MPLKILLADDSMTAQKMGKDILTGAGYEVIAVSNGAAAAKKLVDKPDLFILDMFMPGFSGFEICEKVRASMELSRSPVLLTAGKMEHFDQLDVQRSKADGVIIKPFEATDLIAAVHKLEQKLNAEAATKAAPEETTAPPSAQVEESNESYPEWNVQAEGHLDPAAIPPVPPMAMSPEMGSAPAFMMDDSDATIGFGAPMAQAAAAPIPAPFDFGESANSADHFSAAQAGDFGMGFPSAPMEEAPPIPELTHVETHSVETQSLDSLMHPAAINFEPPVAPAERHHEVEFTSGQKVGHIEIQPEAALERSDEASGEISVPAVDPALVTDPAEISTAFVTKFGVDSEPEYLEVEKGFDESRPEITESVASEVDDFEARVAAAMSGFREETEPEEVVEAAPIEIVAEAVPEPAMEAAPVEIEHEAVSEPTVESVAPVAEEVQPAEEIYQFDAPVTDAPAVEEAAPALHESQLSPEGMPEHVPEQVQAGSVDLPVEVAHVTEESPEIHAAEIGDVAINAVAGAAAEAIGASEEGKHDFDNDPSATVAVDSTPAPVNVSESVSEAAASSGMDANTAAQVVSRVLERMLPAIMTEVAKELEAAKKK